MIISVDALTKRYGEKTAVSNVSFEVEEGHIYGFLGPNGAGKSTLIKMLMGLVFPTSGRGTLLGKPLGNVEARRKVGYLPELFRFQEWMTGDDLLNFHASLYRLKRDPERNRRLLFRVGLEGQGKHKVGAYSKGMQQRLGLACALLPNPELLLLDEPTSALDPIGRKDVRDIIFALKKDGVTVFLNSHLLSEVEAVSDNITIINKGRLVKTGVMRELLGAHLTLTVRTDGFSEEALTYLREKYDAALALEGQGRLTMKLKNPDAVPEIAGYFVQNGARLYELTPHQETLESLFLEAVGEEAAK